MNKLLILTILLSSILFETIAQTENKINTDNKEVYWFFIKPALKNNTSIRKDAVIVKKVYSKIYSGNFDEFMMNYKKGVAKTKVAIGPFSDKQEAKQAKNIYSLNKRNKLNEQKNNTIDKDSTAYYFYVVKPIFNQNTKELKFKRLPGKIATESLPFFKEILSEFGLHELIAIGPFKDYFNAEISKFVNRYEDSNSKLKNKYPSISSVPLTEMAKQWQTVDIKIAKSSIQKKSDVITYDLRVDFPSRYFDSRSLQIIVIELEYTDSTRHNIWAYSFNGIEFEDNNEVIPFENGTVWKQSISAPNFVNKKPQKIIIRSMLFTNYKTLKCEDRIIELKNE